MRTALVALGLSVAGCALRVDGPPVAEEHQDATRGATSVCWQELRQTISGFGASSAWTAPDLPDELADELFSPERIGLSLLRMRIAPDGTTSELATAQKAQARGAAVWAAPWSPPGAWKTSGTDILGGRLLPERHAAWAERLAAFVRATEDAGVELTALSVQNEPDYVANWETCEWEPTELAQFIGEHLVGALAAEGVSPRLLAPESANWDSVADYGDTLLRDPAAGAAVDIVATHAYGGEDAPPYAYGTPAAHGKELWMTEWSDSTNDNQPDSGMTSGLVVARQLHDSLTVASVNAWHYWWLVERGDTPPGKASLVGQDEVTRRAYVVGQYAHFVRPGSVRLGLSTWGPQPGVFASAYLRDGGELVLVAINAKDSAATQTFDFTGADVGELTPTVTNDSVALEPAPPVPGGTEVTLELSPRSVTTFTASVSNISLSPSKACSHLLPEERSDATGCSCRQAGERRTAGVPLGLVALLGLLVAFRRRPRAAA
jgi:glucuronoarabinoxylan endo-1,4-beta-xylanase